MAVMCPHAPGSRLTILGKKQVPVILLAIVHGRGDLTCDQSVDRDRRPNSANGVTAYLSLGRQIKICCGLIQ